jgi:predicted metal-dependent phosphoesterase TrpH
MSVEKIIKRCLEIGINCVNVADHDAVEGGLKMQKIAPFPVIVSEEILTKTGEVMGMFLSERIPSGCSAEEAIRRIGEQGGLVCIPHPYDRARCAALERGFPEELLSEVDVIEIFNARATRFANWDKAKEMAQRYDLAPSAGSDAHTLGEIGNAYVEMPDFISKEDFCVALKQGTVYGHSSGMWVHIPSTVTRIRKRITGKGRGKR